MQLFLVSTRQRRWYWQQHSEFDIFFCAEHHDVHRESMLQRLPLVVDTVGMSVEEQCSIFASLTLVPVLPAALVICDPQRYGHQMLADLCPPIHALVSAEIPFSLVFRILNLLTISRIFPDPPVWFGLIPFSNPLNDPDLYRLLLALRHGETMDDVCRAIAFSPRSLYRKLAQVRAQLHIAPGVERRLSPPALADQIIAALDSYRPMGGDTTSHV
jgi:hypothetical protein